MGISSEDIAKTLKNLDLKPDEMSKLTKAFKDEKFMQLFAEYAKEVSDPKNRAENEAYLRQLEEEGRAEEFYGKGSQLIVPEAALVIKTANAATKEKFFINVCTSAKIDPASSTKAQGGENWDIPFSLGAIHPEVDKSGKPCSAADFCVFDGTLKIARERPRFMTLLVETALEECERRFSVKLDRAVKFPNAKYIGAGADGKPRVQVLQGSGANGPAGDRGRAAPSSSSSQPAAGAEASGSRSKFAFPAPGAKPAAAASADKPERPQRLAKKQHEGPFEFEIVHQSKLDLGNTWKDARAATDGLRPDRLVVRVRLPELAAVSEITLDTSRTSLLVAAQGKEQLIPLPKEVDEERSSAKWDKAKRVLEVSLSVVPAPAPVAAAQRGPEAAAAAGSQPAAEAEAPSEQASAARDAKAEAEAAAARPEGAAAWELAEAPAEAPGAAAAAASEPAELPMTENEAKWRAVHGSIASSSAEPAEDGEEASASGRAAEGRAEALSAQAGCEEEETGVPGEAGRQAADDGGARAAATPSEAGPHEGGQQTAEAPLEAAAHSAGPVLRLKPRLRSVEAVCDELD